MTGEIEIFLDLGSISWTDVRDWKLLCLSVTIIIYKFRCIDP